MTKETREDRLAAALRENLRRRKARARGAAEGDAPSDADIGRDKPMLPDTNHRVD